MASSTNTTTRDSPSDMDPTGLKPRPQPTPKSSGASRVVNGAETSLRDFLRSVKNPKLVGVKLPAKK